MQHNSLLSEVVTKQVLHYESFFLENPHIVRSKLNINGSTLKHSGRKHHAMPDICKVVNHKSKIQGNTSITSPKEIFFIEGSSNNGVLSPTLQWSPYRKIVSVLTSFTICKQKSTSKLQFQDCQKYAWCKTCAIIPAINQPYWI